VGRAVVCGVDGKQHSEAAVRLADALAHELDLPLVFAHAIDGGESEVALRRVRQAAEAAAPDAYATWVVQTGHPVDQLVSIAEEWQAAFLVVGSHGPRSSLLGSVSAGVSRRASCAVVVVPRDHQLVLERPAKKLLASAGGIARFNLGGSRGQR
jgi:nucleotide-binding universal stress UspA family protein